MIKKNVLLKILVLFIILTCRPYPDGQYYYPGDKVSHSVNGVSFNITYIPGGQFKLGSTDPEMTITKGYWLAETEVPQELWEAVMGSNPSYFKGPTYLPDSTETQAKRPVECVTWYDAIEFCNKLSELDGKSPFYTITGITRSGNNIYRCNRKRA